MINDYADGEMFSRNYFNCSEKQLVEELLSELKIPDKYQNFGLSVVAGGSIANTLYSKLYNIPKVIKDIDLFFIRNPFRDEIDENLRDLNAECGYEGCMNHSYIIEKVYTDEIMNLIEIRIGDLGFENPKKHLAEMIISGFDINCCKAGIYRNNLVISNSFVDFLENKKFIVEHPYTPSSTITRLFKKGVDLHIPKESFIDEIDYLKQINFFYSNDKYFFIKTKIIFENYEKKYLPFKDEIDKYFFVLLTEDNLINFAPKGDIDENMLNYIRVYGKPYVTDFRRVWEKRNEKNFPEISAFDIF